MNTLEQLELILDQVAQLRAEGRQLRKELLFVKTYLNRAIIGRHEEPPEPPAETHVQQAATPEPPADPSPVDTWNDEARALVEDIGEAVYGPAVVLRAPQSPPPAPDRGTALEGALLKFIFEGDKLERLLANANQVPPTQENPNPPTAAIRGAVDGIVQVFPLSPKGAMDRLAEVAAKDIAASASVKAQRDQLAVALVEISAGPVLGCERCNLWSQTDPEGCDNCGGALEWETAEQLTARVRRIANHALGCAKRAGMEAGEGAASA